MVFAPSHLFDNYEGQSVFGEIIHSIGVEIDRLPKSQILQTPIEDLVEHFYDRFVVTPVTIHSELATQDQEETMVDVSRDRNRYFSPGSEPRYPGTRITICYPFTGNSRLLQTTPSTFFSTHPIGEISNSPTLGGWVIVVTVEYTIDTNNQRIADDVRRNFDLIQRYLEFANADAMSFNGQLKARIRDRIESRKTRLKKNDGLADLMGIPLRQNPNAPTFNPVGIERKIVKPLPPVPTAAYEPEPGITGDQYEHILSVIRYVGISIEKTPGTFNGMNEENIRDVILAHLNGHYNGVATGEAFRKRGKTDIQIDQDGKSAFVAECKIWTGAKTASQAIDQLLGYLTWRDCKASLIFFNTKNQTFSSIQEKMPDVFQNHPLFKRAIPNSEPGEWRCVFKSQDDELREVTIHTFLFDLIVK